MPSAMLNLGRTLWHISAAMLVLLALAIALVRFMLLNIHHHNDWFEQWITRTLDRPVSIGELSGEWRGWSPSIRLSDLTVYEAGKTATLVHFEYASVDISITNSIKKRDLTPHHITLGGVEFTLERDEQGNFAIAGLPPSRWPVAQWVEGQRRLNLSDARIRFVDLARDNQTQVFDGLQLAIARDGDEREISGSAKRQSASDEQWTFNIRASESILASEWDGKLVLHGQNIEHGYLMQMLNFEHAQPSQETINFSIKSNWRAAKLRSASFQAELSKEKPGDLEAIKVHGNVKRMADGWSLGFLPEQLGNVTYLSDSAPMVRLRWLGDGSELAWTFTDLPIKDVNFAVSTLLPADSPMVKQFQQIKADGLIREASLLTATGEDLKIISGIAKIDSLFVEESQAHPGVTDLNMLFRFNERSGSVHFDEAQNVQVSSSKWLETPLNISRLNGTVHWAKGDSETTFSTKNLAAVVDSFDINVAGAVTIDNLNALRLDVVSYINDGDLSRFANLVPKDVLPKKGERWARSAFRKGRIKEGAIALRGPLRDFPFDNNEGVFEVRFDVEELDLQYSSKWPAAEEIIGSLNIENRNAKFAVAAGKIFSSSLAGSSVEIPDLFTRQRNVEVSGKTTVTGEDVNRFIDASPLKKTNASQFKNVEIDEQFDLELDLNLGIFPGGEKELLGQAHFAGNRIKSSSLELALENLEGSVSFTRLDWYGEGLSATFEGQRVGVLLNGGLDDPNYDTEIRLTGISSAEFLLRQMKTYTPSMVKVFEDAGPKRRLSGSTSWKTVISLPRAEENKAPAPRKLTIESSLEGLEIDLPWPLGKTREQSIPFSMAVHSTRQIKRSSNIRLGERVKARIVESAENGGARSLVGADLVFSPALSLLPEIKGVSLRGELSQLDPAEWQSIARKFATKHSSTAHLLPINLELNVGKLVFFGNHFADIAVLGKHDDEGWHVQLDGASLSGEIGAPDNTDLPVHLKFSRIALAEGLNTTTPQALDPRTFRPLSLESLSTTYGDIDLGKVSVSTERIENGVKITHAVAEQGSFVMRGTGEWIIAEGINQSRLDASVKGQSLVGLLGGFGYDIANIEGGATELQLNAYWPGTPADFELEKLRGHLSLDVESGRFLDIEPGGGRLFGLLSLQTLPRRLSLDFNDLFSKGFTFDNIDGTFSIEQGNAYTNSLLMDGPSARILISGRTGLQVKDYDQIVTVTPALSNSIPVASALFGPAGIGVGAVIYLGQKMFKSIPEQMDKFLSREYSITGEWSAPVIEKL